MLVKLSLAAIAVATTALALVTPRSLPTSTVTCGSDKYSVSQISSAISKGYAYLEEGKTIGSDTYPHQYYDDEKLTMYCSGTYYEYPILSGGSAYSGGSPGADRVVFNGSGTYCAVITHTGASSYDGFIACKGD